MRKGAVLSVFHRGAYGPMCPVGHHDFRMMLARVVRAHSAIGIGHLQPASKVVFACSRCGVYPNKA